MKMKTLLKSVIILTSLLASQVQASLVLERYGSGATPTSIGGYEMTDFAFLEPGPSTSTVNSPLGGTLSFEDHSGNPIALT